jgi:hypothetical protein
MFAPFLVDAFPSLLSHAQASAAKPLRIAVTGTSFFVVIDSSQTRAEREFRFPLDELSSTVLEPIVDGDPGRSPWDLDDVLAGGDDITHGFDGMC